MNPFRPGSRTLAFSALCYVVAYRASERLWGESPERAVDMFRRWSRRACRWLGIDVRVCGVPRSEPCVYLANHRSYLDIPVLSGALGATFVSRGDVATWPVVGAAARAVKVVFVDRDDAHAGARAARMLARRVGTLSTIVFPEGTTCGDALPGPLSPGLFRLLHRLRVPIVPVTIRYDRRDLYWVEEVSLADHLRTRVLAGPPSHSVVHIGDALRSSDYESVETLREAAHRALCRPIEESGELVALA
jgi:1-acyl-sn-glycerol-3-phosphate acyltransferase